MIRRFLRALRRDGLRLFTSSIDRAVRRLIGYQRVVIFRAGGTRPPTATDAVTELDLASASSVSGIPWNPPSIAKRLEGGSRLFALREGADYKSFGWVTDAPSIFIGETACRVAASEAKIWIWDCVTPAQFRGRGYYPELLRGIVGSLDHTRAMIFCRAENRASRRGIEKAGFISAESVVRVGRRSWIRSGARTADPLVIVPGGP